jgi:hypothetical protein
MEVLWYGVIQRNLYYLHTDRIFKRQNLTKWKGYLTFSLMTLLITTQLTFSYIVIFNLLKH